MGPAICVQQETAGIHMEFDSRTRLAFVINSLGVGGAQRALSNMACHWASAGVPVRIYTFERSAGQDFHLPREVELRCLDCRKGGKISANLRRVRALRLALKEQPADVVISFQDVTNVISILACMGTGVRVIGAERTDPSMHRIGKVWEVLRTMTYPFAGRIVFQTSRAMESMPRRVVSNSVVIPNPVVAPDCPRQKREKVICSLGRLAPEKGYGNLIAAFSKAADTHPEWTLELLGDGPQRVDLEALAQSAGLSARVIFRGHTAEPARELARAGIFVLSSEYEGFPNAMCEAMACGLPAVAFDCPSGPGDIIRHGVDGYLVPPGDVDGLAERLDILMANDEKCAAMGLRAREIIERFSMITVMNAWEELIVRVMGK